MGHSGPRPAEEPVPVRTLRFEYPDDFRAAWQPLKPELAYACNALSLGLPHGEPYVVSSIRQARRELRDGALTGRVDAFLAQEREHYRQHRRFNDLVIAQHPALRHVERALGWSYRTLGRRGSRRFNVACSVGFETAAFAASRWMDGRRRELFDGADPVPATLFLWHLAEEVEHKTVAYDVWEEIDGGRLRYAVAASLAFVMLAFFIFLGTVVQLAATRRVFSPVAWIRLTKWAVGFAFEVMPILVLTALPGHHPRELADPPWLPTWLRHYDPTTGTIPLWNAPLTEWSEPVEASAQVDELARTTST